MTPNHRKFRDYPHETDELRPVPAGPPRVHAVRRPVDEPADGGVEPLSYSWKGWDEPTYHEREKPSYGILREAFARKELETP